MEHLLLSHPDIVDAAVVPYVNFGFCSIVCASLNSVGLFFKFDTSYMVILIDRYPDEESGQVPMAFVVRRLASVVDESQVMDYIAKQVIQTIPMTCLAWKDEFRDLSRYTACDFPTL